MKKITILSFVLLIAGATQAQSTINSTGNTKVVNGITHSYSIGEMVLINTATSNNIIVTQGVLQDPGSAVGIMTANLTDNEFKVYPNPTKDLLNLQANLQEKGGLTIKLYDVSGREMLSKQWKMSSANEQQQLNLQSYAVGYYILNVQYKKGNKVAQQSYKIQKLK